MWSTLIHGWPQYIITGLALVAHLRTYRATRKVHKRMMGVQKATLNAMYLKAGESDGSGSGSGTAGK